MCRGRLDWGTVPSEYRKWVLKSRDSQAVLHRDVHRAVIVGMDTSVIYKVDKEEVRVWGNTSSVIIGSRLTHKRLDQFELSSMNHVDRIVAGAWQVLNYKLDTNYGGDVRDLIDAINELNSCIAA
jgi:hypothetical protein